MNIEETLKNIRTDCRRAMNGVISTSMREYGLDYKLNFGLVTQQIKSLAHKYGPSASLAEKLWYETTRELKILATLIYPVDEFKIETAQEWAASIPNQEIREQVCINLFQKLPYASELAVQWSQRKNKEERTTGYWLMTRLLLTKKYEGELALNAFDQYIWEDVIATDIFIRNAASLVLKHIVRRSKEDADYILNKLFPYKDSDELIKKEAYQSIAFEIEFMYS